jgi:transcriptional regulator with XRE-family HTH domain
MSLQRTFIANLKKYRKACGLSQMLLAERCGLSTNYIGQIEMGRRIPAFQKIEKIAAVLHIQPHLLFQEEAANVPEKKPPATAKDVLTEMPPRVCREMQSRLLRDLQSVIRNTFNPGKY